MANELRSRGDLTFDQALVLSDESFVFRVPASYRRDRPAGLFVWISSGSDGRVPREDWVPVLEQHGLIWAGANGAGNDRDSTVRVALALHAVATLGDRYAIDENRTYVGGVSGGAKSALRALLAYPDVFRGGVFVVGAAYYRQFAATSAGQGRFWPPSMGAPKYAAAKSRRIVFVTGSGDFNRGSVLDVRAAMLEDAFSAVTVLDIPGLGHDVPIQSDFEKAMANVEGAGR